jgi:hypothetical protein
MMELDMLREIEGTTEESGYIPFNIDSNNTISYSESESSSDAESVD